MLYQWSRWSVWAAAIFFGLVVCYVGARVGYVALLAPGHAHQDGLVHDLGQVFWGETKEFKLKFKNVRQAPLTIDRVVHECGCTIIGLELKGRQLAPGESIDIPVRFSVGSMDGQLAKRILLFVDGDSRRAIKLNIKADSKKPISIAPTQLAFADAPGKASVAKTIAIDRVSGAPPLTISEVRTSTPRLAAEVQESSGDEAGRKWLVVVRTVPPLAPGRTDETLYIRTSEPAMGTIEVRVVLVVKE